MNARAWTSLLPGAILVVCLAPAVASASFPPFVEIVEPMDGRAFGEGPPGRWIVVSARTNATAAAPINRVEFYEGNQFIGQDTLDTAGQYQIFWSNVTTGAYALRAVAITFNSQMFTSPPVNITVTSVPPMVRIYSPADNALVRAGTNVLVAAYVGSFRPVLRVAFFQGTFFLGQDSVAPYELLWGNLPPGEFALRAVATIDNLLMYTSPPVNLKVVTNLPPSVRLMEPVNDSVFSEGGISVSASAADADGSVARIEFFAEELKLGEVAGSRGSLFWSNVAAGSYALTARATDDVGGGATSAPVRIRVLPTGVTELVRGPYLQLGIPNSMIVKWRTVTLSDSRVRYGTDAGQLNLIAEDGNAKIDHEIQLSGLQPDTRYYYAVGSSTQPLASGPDHFFVTSPAGPKPTRIWVIGDSGTGTESARNVWRAYAAYTGPRYTDAWLMLGDNAYGAGTDEEYQRAVFEMYPDLLRQTPLWPTLGNHDIYDSYFDIFTLPTHGEAGGIASGTEHYYSFDYGDIHFVCLDAAFSDRSGAGSMCTWLREDLDASTKKWTIAYWHHPPYSKGSHDSDGEFELVEMRQNVVPILESNGVDLVLCGHSHSYERSFLLRGHYGVSTTLTPSMVLDTSSGRPEETGAYFKYTTGPAAGYGTVYVVAGSSGQVGFGSFDHPAMFKSLPVMGSLVLDIDGDILQCKFLGQTGEIDDTFALHKTDPQLRVTQLRNVNGLVELSWQSLPGRQYQVERTATLSPQDWKPIGTLFPSGGTRTTWSHALSPGASAGFYRVIQW